MQAAGGGGNKAAHGASRWRGGPVAGRQHGAAALADRSKTLAARVVAKPAALAAPAAPAGPAPSTRAVEDRVPAAAAAPDKFRRLAVSGARWGLARVVRAAASVAAASASVGPVAVAAAEAGAMPDAAQAVPAAVLTLAVAAPVAVAVVVGCSRGRGRGCMRGCGGRGRGRGRG